jgi:myo-inositol-hexaphosphate 3-phosphohydrolase
MRRTSYFVDGYPIIRFSGRRRVPRPLLLALALIFGFVLTVGLPADRADAAPVFVTPSVETVPGLHGGDAIDDPSVWIHPTDRSLSTIIDTDKDSAGGLNVHDLAGQRLFFYPQGPLNNVDLRYNFPLGTETVDLVGASNREGTLDFFKVNAADRSLAPVGSVAVSPAIGEPYGFALYRSPASGKYYAFVTFEGNTDQYELNGSTGSVTGTLVRQFTVADEATEGLVADDVLARVYLGGENTALYRYGAEPTDPTTGVVIDNLTGQGGNIVPDLEGLSIYYGPGGAGYLIASVQGANSYHIYNRGDNGHLGEFQVIAGGGIDEVTGTDGIDVTNAALGSAFPHGVFVAQDTTNSNAGNGNGGNQNTKAVSWAAIANAFNPPLLINTSWDPRQVGAPSNDTDGDGYTDGDESLHIGTDAFDACGADAWPSDVVSEGSSHNRLDIYDLAGFLGPIRRYETSPGDLNFDARFDLKPGPMLGTGPSIDVLDLVMTFAGDTGFPPMLGGARAFDQSCPIAP